MGFLVLLQFGCITGSTHCLFNHRVPHTVSLPVCALAATYGILLAKCFVHKMAVATGDRDWNVKVARLVWEPTAPSSPNQGPMGAAAAAAVEFLEAQEAVHQAGCWQDVITSVCFGDHPLEA